jgi:small ligand-binding sensory domain FIST
MIRLLVCLCLIPITTASFQPLPLKNPQVSQSQRSTRLRGHDASASSSWQSHVSTHPLASSALDKIFAECTEKTPDVAFLFVGQYHADHFPNLVQRAASLLPSNCHLLSVIGGGVVGERVELDEPSKPSISLLLGRVPQNAQVETFAFNTLTKPPPPKEDYNYWNKLANVTAGETSSSPSSASFFLLADPWSPVDSVIQNLEATKANNGGAVITGGISVPTGTGPTVGLGPQALPQGSVVGIRFGGSLGIQAIVAQGCRPLGPTFTVTNCEHNVILELDRRPAIQALENVIQAASDEKEKQKISSGLVIGLYSSTANNKEPNDTADYLIRQISGFVPSKGAFVVSGGVKKGDRIRFHVRDKQAAEEDLKLMVQRAQTEKIFHQSSARPLAALQVSCVGRGRYMFGYANVDLSHIQELVEGASVAGFYANGELGPVGLSGFSKSNTGGTFMHGFTTVVALLCEFDTDTSHGAQGMGDVTTTDQAPYAWG